MSPRHTWDGDDDAEAVAIATNYLNSNLPEGYYAVSQPYLLVDPGGEHATSLVMNVQKSMLKTMRSGYRMVVAHPDIVVMRESVDTGWANMIVCAVELDGSIHDSRPGKKQTDKRNKKYRLAEVPRRPSQRRRLPRGGHRAAEIHVRRRGVLPAGRQKGAYCRGDGGGWLLPCPLSSRPWTPRRPRRPPAQAQDAGGDLSQHKKEEGAARH